MSLSPEIDALDVIDELNKELASLRSMHLMLHAQLKVALSSNEPMPISDLRNFNSGLENLSARTFARTSALLAKLAQETAKD